MRVITLAVLLAGIAGTACADRLFLKDGNVVQGTYLGGTARQIRMDVDGSVRNFEIDQIRSISFSEEGGQQAPPPPPPPRTLQQDYSTRNPDPPRGGDGLLGNTVPADTSLTVRMIDPVDSQTARTGQTFRASLDEPIMVDGRTVIPRGADVVTKLVYDQQSGKIEGRTVLTMALSTINVNGQIIDLTSSDVKTESTSRGAKSGGVIGGGAAVGAIIGAIAGGGKGAAIGAASGGALGAGTQVLTKGQQVKIPSETRLTFRLQSPAQL